MIHAQYAAIRADLAQGVLATLLHIGAEQTVILSDNGVKPATLLTLALGTEKTAREYFRHAPPTPGEIENAIMPVEDEVARARPVIARNAMLFSTDAGIRDIAQLASLPDQAEVVISLAAIERTFDRLAALSQGQPAAQAGIPPGKDFAARLLILREFMHHLQFAEITLKQAIYLQAF